MDGPKDAPPDLPGFGVPNGPRNTNGVLTAIPGTYLRTTAEFKAGKGTYLDGTQIRSSLAGVVTVTKPSPAEAADKASSSADTSAAAAAAAAAAGASGPRKRLSQLDEIIVLARAEAAPKAKPDLPTVSVARPRRSLSNRIPLVGDIVVCRVDRLGRFQAFVTIHQIEDDTLRYEWPAVIRLQHVMLRGRNESPALDLIPQSFRPGDTVKARVISLGVMSTNRLLTTAGSELGVIIATSTAGNVMVPHSWNDFIDPVTMELEFRKVARP